MTSEVLVRDSETTQGYHVVIMREKLEKTREDRYIVSIAEALKKSGHFVTILTTSFNRNDCLPELEPALNNIKVMSSSWWIPTSLFGNFKRTFSFCKAIWMSLRMIFFPPKPRPKVVILDINPVALLLLGLFSNYSTYFVEHFTSLKDIECFTSHMKITPPLLSAWGMKYATEILLQTECMACIFRRSYPGVLKDIKVFTPYVDKGIWDEECIDINRIIPDLPKDCILFSVFGRYCKRSNFRLALSAFEHLLSMLSDKPSEVSKIHIVFAGHTKTIAEKVYYTEIIEMTKEKHFASQVTFLRQVPVVHKKTLICKSRAVIHPTKYDVFTGPLIAAMYLGTTVIATNTGLATKIFSHRINGILIDPDPVKFAAAMFKVIEKPALAEYLQSMAQNVYRNHHCFDAFSRRLDHLIRKCYQKDFKLKEA